MKMQQDFIAFAQIALFSHFINERLILNTKGKIWWCQSKFVVTHVHGILELPLNVFSTVKVMSGSDTRTFQRKIVQVAAVLWKIFFSVKSNSRDSRVLMSWTEIYVAQKKDRYDG